MGDHRGDGSGMGKLVLNLTNSFTDRDFRMGSCFVSALLKIILLDHAGVGPSPLLEREIGCEISEIALHGEASSDEYSESFVSLAVEIVANFCNRR